MIKKFRNYIIAAVVVIVLAVVYLKFQDSINVVLKGMYSLIKHNIYIALGILFLFSFLDSSIGLIGPSGSALFVAALYYDNYFLLSSVSYLGFLSGSTIMYLLGRYFQKHIKKFQSGKIHDYYVKNQELSVVVFSATAAANVVSVLSGYNKMNFLRFVIMTFIGRFVVAYYVGTNLLRLLNLYRKTGDVFTLIWIILLLIVCIIIYVVIYLWKRKYKDESNS